MDLFAAIEKKYVSYFSLPYLSECGYKILYKPFANFWSIEYLLYITFYPTMLNLKTDGMEEFVELD